MPRILEILTIPKNNEILRKKSLPVNEEKVLTEEFKELCEDLEETMIKKEGVGLAAPQIGRNIRMIVVNTKNGPVVMINPKIIKKSLLKEWGEEGCLSVPMTFGDVKRHKKVTCIFCNRRGKKDQIKGSGLLARVIQHEIDHLDGILFIDKAKNVTKLEEADRERMIDEMRNA
jgi:peptide deformylase